MVFSMMGSRYSVTHQVSLPAHPKGMMPAATVAGPRAAIPPLATERDVVGAVGCAVPSVFAFPVGVALEREMTLV